MAPVISLFWGIGVVLLVKFVQPQVHKDINWEEGVTHGYFALIIAIGMTTDFVLTMISVHRFHIKTKMWNERIQADLDKKKLAAQDLRFKDTGRLNAVKSELLKRKLFK